MTDNRARLIKPGDPRYATTQRCSKSTSEVSRSSNPTGELSNLRAHVRSLSARTQAQIRQDAIKGFNNLFRDSVD